MPERVITTINTPTKQAVESALFAWNDVAKTRKGGNGSQGYIILNNKKKKLNIKKKKFKEKNNAVNVKEKKHKQKKLKEKILE